MVIQQFPLNMVPGREVLEVHVNQYDGDFQLFFDMYQGASGYAAASGTTVTIRGTKPDGNGYSANATITQTAACTTVRVDGARQLTAACGVGSFELVFAKSGKEVSSANFHLCVERAAMDLGTISDSEILELYNLTREDFEDVLSAKAAAESAADAAQAARDTAWAGYITRSASGSSTAFEDGADAVPVKSLTVQIAPVQAGSGDPSPDNIRPISGVSSATVTRTGKNLVGIEPFTAYWATQSLSIQNAVNALPIGQYTLSAKFTITRATEPATANTYRYGVSLAEITMASVPTWPAGSVVGDTAIYSISFEITESNRGGCTAAYFYGYGTYASGAKGDAEVSEIQLEYGGVRTPYTPYQGQTVTLPLTDGPAPLAVYGGTLNVTTGTLSVTWANIAGYAGETLPGRWISDRDVYAVGTSPTTGAQVCYELASPLTYRLTPQEVTTLLGVNTIAANCGTVGVTYRADAGIVVKKLEDEIDDLRSAILSMGSNV